MNTQKYFSILFTMLLGSVCLSGCMAQKQSVLLDVPFQPQAPYGAWDSLHEEACEEMSLIMVHHYLEGTPLTQSGAEAEVQQMVAWETAHHYGVDVSMSQMADITAALYPHYHTRILTDVTADTLRSELDAGHPIIVPADGRALQNPHFEGAAPFYHVLVVTGYKDDTFITNEPGTKDGGQYAYSADVLLNALHDWNGAKDQIAGGAKTALVIER